MKALISDTASQDAGEDHSPRRTASCKASANIPVGRRGGEALEELTEQFELEHYFIWF